MNVVEKIAELGGTESKEKDKKLRDLLTKSFPVIQIKVGFSFFLHNPLSLGILQPITVIMHVMLYYSFLFFPGWIP